MVDSSVGYDLAWDGADVSAYDATVTGSELIAQSVAARWTTPAGGLWYDETYGGGLFEWFRSSSPAAPPLMVRRLRMAAMADDRVKDCEVRLKYDESSSVWQITGIIVPYDTAPTTVTISSDGTIAYS